MQISYAHTTKKQNVRSATRAKKGGMFLLRILLLLLWSIIVVVPLAVLLMVAIKSAPEVLNNPLGLPKELHWLNFVEAWQNANLGQAFLNSILITTISIAGLIVIGASAAYPLARETGSWSNRLYIYFIAGIIVPAQLGIIPLYREMHDLQLVNTYQGVILITIAGNLPLVIFLFTGFIKTLPRDLDEAALLDGASRLRIFWTILFPLLKPITSTVVITTGLNIWNDFLTPLLFLQGEDHRTMPLAIFSFVGEYNNDWSHIFASVVLSALPMLLVFFALQKYFIKGISSGALKG